MRFARPLAGIASLAGRGWETQNTVWKTPFGTIGLWMHSFFHSKETLAWLPLQSLAVKKKN